MWKSLVINYFDKRGYKNGSEFPVVLDQILLFAVRGSCANSRASWLVGLTYGSHLQ